MSIGTTSEVTHPAEARRAVSPRRLLSIAVLGGWGGLFWFLLLTGRSSLYLSPRTDWLVPVGAILLAIATAGRLLSVRAWATERVSTREVWTAALLLFPVVAVMTLPPAALGSYAVERRSTFSSVTFAASTEDIAEGDISFLDLAGAQRDEDAMKVLASRAGTEVSFVGFVARDRGAPADEFDLTRFIVTCCVADALSIQVRVVGTVPGRHAKDDWVEVTGRLYPLGTEFIVVAGDVTQIERPKAPYITP